MSFVHLHTHTVYSLLDGSNKIKNYIAKVKADGQNAAAITDHGVMYGCIYFYQEAKKQGINPIIGSEIYVSPGSRFDREPGDNDDKYYHLILLAENNTGYQNLMKIVSIDLQKASIGSRESILKRFRNTTRGSSAFPPAWQDRCRGSSNRDSTKRQRR